GAPEAGGLPVARRAIADRGRLGAGGMLVVDLVEGCVVNTADIRRQLARCRPYRSMVRRAVVRGVRPGPGQHRAATPLVRRQAAFGCSREEIELLLKPMAADGTEAVGSMGDDTPPAVLSARPRLFSDCFRQRFAQVTNPAVDPYRESVAMSLRTLLGASGRYL